MVIALFVALLGCDDGSVLPDGAVFYDVTVTAEADECHAGGEGITFQQVYSYALVFSGSAVNVYMREKSDEGAEYQEGAQGLTSGCDITYSSPIIGETLEDGLSVKWVLDGTAIYDGGDDGCVEGAADWEGTETFTIVSVDDEEVADPSVEEGCQYLMSSSGTISAEAP